MSSTTPKLGAQIRNGRIGRSDHGRRFRRDLFVGFERSLGVFVFQTEVFGLIGRASIDEGLSSGATDLLVLSIEQPLQGLPVRFQRASKGRDRGKQALLQANEGELGKRGFVRGQLGNAAPAQLTVSRKPAP